MMIGPLTKIVLLVAWAWGLESRLVVISRASAWVHRPRRGGFGPEGGVRDEQSAKLAAARCDGNHSRLVCLGGDSGATL